MGIWPNTFTWPYSGPDLTHGLSVSDIAISNTTFSDHMPVSFSVPYSEISPWCVSLVPLTRALVKSLLSLIMKYRFLQKWNLLSTTWMLNLIHFNSTCAFVLNSNAPLKLRNHKSAAVLWHKETTRTLRQACRHAERKWKKDKLQVSYEIMRNSLTMFQRAAKAAKCKYLSKLILN